MVESSNIFYFMDLIISRLYYSSICLDYFFITLLEMGSGYFYLIRPLCIFFPVSGIHPMFRRGSHNNQPQMGQCSVLGSDIPDHSFRIVSCFPVDGFPFPGDGDKTVPPAGSFRMDGVVTLPARLATELHFHDTSRPGEGEGNSVETVILGTVLGGNPVPAPFGRGHPAGVLVRIRTCLPPYPFKIPVDKMTAGVKHLVTELFLFKTVQPFVGNDRVLPRFPWRYSSAMRGRPCRVPQYSST